MTQRARRRADLERMKARAVRLFKGPLRGRNLDYARIVAEHITCCSCWMCGNPRRHLGELTMQERRRFQCVDAE